MFSSHVDVAQHDKQKSVDSNIFHMADLPVDMVRAKHVLCVPDASHAATSHPDRNVYSLKFITLETAGITSGIWIFFSN